MFFKKAAAAVIGSSNKLSGRTDLLESACAAAAYVASADGNVSDEEVEAALKSLRATKQIADSFSDADITKTLDKMFDKAKGGRAGRAQLIDEINDIAKDPELAGLVMYVALDVADDGGIDEKEMPVLEKIAKELQLQLKNFLDA